VATPIAARNFSNTTLPTSLTTNIDNLLTSTNIPVQSTAGYPVVPFTGCFERNTINQEFCLVTAIPDANHFTVVRGYDGTPALPHLAPATFEHCVGAIDYREANWHNTDTTRDDHLQYLLTNGSRASTGLQAFNAGISTQFVNVAGFPNAYVQTRYVGGTAGPGPPGGSLPFQAGDWVIDTLGHRWTCITAGSPGTWTVEAGRMVGHYQNTGSLADAANNTITITTASFTAVKGVSYVVDAAYQGTIITAVPTYVNAVLYSNPNIFAYNSYIFTIDNAAYVLGNVIQGCTCAGTNAVATTQTVNIMVNIQSAGSGGLRTTAGGLEVIVRTA
jgi:hypothetical protein